MKVVFDQSELGWLRGVVTEMVIVSHKQGQGELGRRLARMRGKFSPNASYVNLGTKEVELILMTTRYYIGSLGDRVLLADDYPVVKTIEEKIHAAEEARN